MSDGRKSWKSQIWFALELLLFAVFVFAMAVLSIRDLPGK